MDFYEIYFINKEQISSYLISGAKICIDDCYWKYWKVFSNGVGCFDISDNSLIKCEKIDDAVSLIWKGKNCKIDLE